MANIDKIKLKKFYLIIGSDDNVYTKHLGGGWSRPKDVLTKIRKLRESNVIAVASGRKKVEYMIHVFTHSGTITPEDLDFAWKLSTAKGEDKKDLQAIEAFRKYI